MSGAAINGAGVGACEACLRRRWVLETLAPRLERERARIDDLLVIADGELIELVAGTERSAVHDGYVSFGAREARRMREAAECDGVELVCAHDHDYPTGLRELAAPPAVLSVNGGRDRLSDLCAGETVAVVGTRRPTPAGDAVARDMARGLAVAGVCVASGMAYGIDTAAHLGALDGGARTLVVLAGSAARPSPKGKAALFRRVLAAGGVAISELGLEVIWRWALQARNRLIAGLAEMTVIIEASERSGSLITARQAGALGRWIGAVPGPVDSPQAAGPNQLLAKARAGTRAVDPSRIRAIRGAQDVLDILYGEGIIEVSASRLPEPTQAESALLARIHGGLVNVTRLAPGDLVALAGLELKGWVTRGPGGALVTASKGGARWE